MEELVREAIDGNSNDAYLIFLIRLAYASIKSSVEEVFGVCYLDAPNFFRDNFVEWVREITDANALMEELSRKHMKAEE